MSKINTLFQNAQAEGTLSTAAVNALTVVDIGAEIQAGLGIDVDDVAVSEVILLNKLIDDSGSISMAGNDEAVIEGNNLVDESLLATKQKNNIFSYVRYLNGKVLYPYCPLEQGVKMNKRNYQADGGTPLYDQTFILLATVVAKAQQFIDNGVPARTITLIVTDGEDLHSTKADAGMIKKVVKDILKEGTNIVAGMGLDNGRTDFRKIFCNMGIDDKWILTPGNTASEIRKAFNVFSQSAVRASQSAVNFSQTAMGGFTKP